MSNVFQQSVRFGMVGCLNTLVGLSTIYLLMLLGLNPLIANLFGYGGGFIISFLFNKKWTFASRQKISESFSKYLFLGIVCYLLNLFVVVFCKTKWHMSYYYCQVFGIFAYTGTMFVGCRTFVFK